MVCALGGTHAPQRLYRVTQQLHTTSPCFSLRQLQLGSTGPNLLRQSAPQHLHQHLSTRCCASSNNKDAVMERRRQQRSGVVKPTAGRHNEVAHASSLSGEHLADEPQHQLQQAKKQQPTSDSAAWVTEVYKLGKLAIPLLLQYVIANSSHLINTSFVGHLSDPVMLSSMVMATSLSMATGYSIMSGVASVSETLCGQAFGAKNYSALQETLQRALLIVAMTCVPVTLVWSHAEAILLTLGQPAAIAAGAARYLHLTLPALYLYCVHECCDKYLLSQRVVKPSLAITAATTALTPLLAWLFVVHLDMGLDGAAYAYVGVQACTTALGLSYLAYRELVKLPQDPPEGWSQFRPSMGALANWGPYVALAVPAVMSYCMEGWATEVLIFLSGMLPNAEVAVGVTGLALQFSTLVWLAAASIGSASSTRVANKLGRGDAAGAKRTAQTATASVLVTQALIGVTAYTYREPLLQLMTNNPEVIKLALEVMPVLACCFIADGLNAVQGAVLRGAGRQWWTAGLNILGWWGVGVPLAYYLSIVQGANVPGLWGGFAIASCLQSGLQFVAISRFVDWDVEVQRAREMMSSPPPESSDDEDTHGGGSGGGGSRWSPHDAQQQQQQQQEVVQEEELVLPRVRSAAAAASGEFAAIQGNGSHAAGSVVLRATLPEHRATASRDAGVSGRAVSQTQQGGPAARGVTSSGTAMASMAKLVRGPQQQLAQLQRSAVGLIHKASRSAGKA